jgi:hypothetical protein
MDLNLGIKNDLIDDDDLMNMKSVSFEESKRTNDNNNDYSNMSLNELVTSLKGKLKMYETEVGKLIDDKLKMQMEINNLQLENMKLKKNNQNPVPDNTVENNLIGINSEIKKQNINLKSELDNLDKIIQNHKNLISNNNNLSEGNSIICSNCQIKDKELEKLKNEKQEICLSINDLKKQLEELKANEKKIKKKKDKKEKINKSESLPNIEQYFILNNKFQLVDSDRNLWHMKKCRKFQEFKEKNKSIYKSSEDILKAFVDTYENKSDEENEEEDNKNNNNEYNNNNNNVPEQKKNEQNEKNDNKTLPIDNKSPLSKDEASLSLSDNSI